MTRQQLIDNALEAFRKEFKEAQEVKSGEYPVPDYLYFDFRNFLTTHLNLMADSVIEGIKEDYINWVFKNSYGSEKYPYKGITPFEKWKDEADVKDMQNWK